MTTGRRLKSTAVIAAGALSLVAACGTVDRAGDRPTSRVVTLRMVDPLSSGDLASFVSAVNRLSHGTVRLNLTSRWHPEDETRAVALVRSGGTDLADVPARAWDDVGVRSFDALIAPFVIDSLDVERAVLGSDLPGRMLKGVAPLGLIGLGVVLGPLRKPAGISRALMSPADFRHASIGISESVIAKKYLAALGARPVPLHFINQSISPYDGVEEQVSSFDGNVYARAASSITGNVSLWPRPLTIVANAKVFSRLSAAQQTVLRRAAAESLTDSLSAQQSQVDNAVNYICRTNLLRFVNATPADINQLHAAARPVLSWLNTDSETRSNLAAIAQIRTKTEGDASNDVPPSCDGIPPVDIAQPASGKPGPLDGTWSFNITKSQLIAAGAAPDEILAENYGDTVWVIAHGRFASTQQNSAACTWAYGSWNVTKRQIEVRITDGGGIAPNGAASKPGELFDVTYSLYRDTFTLGRVPGAASPSGLLVQPFRRLSTKPEPDLLFHRCEPPAKGIPK